MTYTRNSPLIQLFEVVPQHMYQIVGYGLSGTLYKKLVTKPTSCAREDARGPRGFATTGQTALRGETRTRRRREMFVLKSYTSIFAVLRSIGVAW